MLFLSGHNVIRNNTSISTVGTDVNGSYDLLSNLIMQVSLHPHFCGRITTSIFDANSLLAILAWE